MPKKISFLLLFLFLMEICFAQLGMGGSYVYNFREQKFSARLAGLGGTLIAVHDNDPSLIMHNPSMIAPKFNTSLLVHATDYFGHTGNVAAMYSQTFNKVGSFAAEIRYAGYGTFIHTDETGYELGTFSCNDAGFTLGWGRPLDSAFSIGANLKMMYSSYEMYSSFGLAVDVAGSYYNEKNNISLAILFRNIGGELKPFVEGKRNWAPFDIQFAFSQQLKFVPIRYHIALHSLYKWEMSYIGSNDPTLEIDAITGEPKYPSTFNRGINNFFSHINFGLEIIPIKYLSLFVSYNHHQNREMRIPQRKTMAGFAYGFQLNINSIQFGFSRSHYAAGATPNYFTFSLNINDLSQISKEKNKKKLERVN
ncbi:MAG: type IX secretion system protein PorQ [Lentimicrobiaceae bacterium]|nr:type IX secretion system protein PorQ [Lentimicrobiaceae bacterium]